ncbi:MAG: Gfo/Idh/MocA family oxidoreductase [Candidatus Fermentibacteraceae bacterium]|nr:Gfo/Idh/MocA family oxidoreductase [Candidatus Fermentibacteraceae bacterium]MBN2609505.1 Gfo/Idh/MocA family oxidoreductase [Candidatus Fermentibacteraceae bacterium]
MVDVGVIGLGYWGPNLLRNLYTNQRSGRLVICDCDPARAGRMRSRYPDLYCTADCREVFGDDGLDAVVIATDVSSHYPLAKLALEAGKHVFVEKPFASSVEQAEELVELGRRKGLVTMVGHTFMFSPPVIKAKEIIDSGELGDIYFITASRVNLGLHQKDVSVIWDLAPHDFSMLFYWLGEEPSRVSAFGHAYVLEGIPDVAFINLAFPSGSIGNVQVAWLAPSKLRRTVIVGSSKMLVYDDTEPIEKIKIYDKGVELIEPESFGEYQLTYRTGDILSPKLSSDEPLGSEMEEFLASIEEGRTPRSSGEEGLAVVRALEKAEKSLRKASG